MLEDVCTIRTSIHCASWRVCTTRTQCTLRILEDVYNLFKRTLCIEEDVYSPYTVYILDDVYNRYAVYILHDVYNP